MHPVACTIDPYASHQHRVALSARRGLDALNNTIRFYEQRPHLEPYTPVDTLLVGVHKGSRSESKALRTLNCLLLDAGLNPEQVVQVDEHLYRASNPGCLAAYLGQVPPNDSIPAEASEALDDALEHYGELAERRSEYLAMVAIN